MIPLGEQDYIREVFEQALTGPVKVEYFTQRRAAVFVPGREDCQYCEDVQQMLAEIAALSGKVSLRVHELAAAPAEARRYGVERVPATVLRGVLNRPLVLYGIPAGTFFPVLIELFVAVSNGETGLEPALRRRLKRVKRDVSVELFTSPEDPNGPLLGRLLGSLALENNHIKLAVIEASEFPALVQERGVESVPVTVLDGHTRITGLSTPAEILDQIVKASESNVTAPAQRRPGSGTLDLRAATDPQAGETRPSGLIIPRR